MIVFTNGVFDLMHVGHCRFLAWARAHGDRLVVGLNSDDSVRRLKGPDRPVIPQHERLELLLHLREVSDVVIFDDDTPLTLIESIKPDVLAKGPDWRGKDIAGAAFVTGYGGRVVTPDWPILHSTSQLFARMRT